MHRRGWWLIVWIAVTSMAGCTHGQTRPEDDGQVPLPDRLLVYDLTVSAGAVELDRGLAEHIVQATQGTPRTFQEAVRSRRPLGGENPRHAKAASSARAACRSVVSKPSVYQV